MNTIPPENPEQSNRRNDEEDRVQKLAAGIVTLLRSAITEPMSGEDIDAVFEVAQTLFMARAEKNMNELVADEIMREHADLCDCEHHRGH